MDGVNLQTLCPIAIHLVAIIVLVAVCISIVREDFSTKCSTVSIVTSIVMLIMIIIVRGSTIYDNLDFDTGYYLAMIGIIISFLCSVFRLALYFNERTKMTL